MLDADLDAADRVRARARLGLRADARARHALRRGRGARAPRDCRTRRRSRAMLERVEAAARGGGLPPLRDLELRAARPRVGPQPPLLGAAPGARPRHGRRLDRSARRGARARRAAREPARARRAISRIRPTCGRGRGAERRRWRAARRVPRRCARRAGWTPRASPRSSARRRGASSMPAIERLCGAGLLARGRDEWRPAAHTPREAALRQRLRIVRVALLLR